MYCYLDLKWPISGYGYDCICVRTPELSVYLEDFLYQWSDIQKYIFSNRLCPGDKLPCNSIIWVNLWYISSV